jgi:hypothetical protein
MRLNFVVAMGHLQLNVVLRQKTWVVSCNNKVGFLVLSNGAVEVGAVGP